jgi:hypothetical protein
MVHHNLLIFGSRCFEHSHNSAKNEVNDFIELYCIQPTLGKYAGLEYQNLLWNIFDYYHC